MLSFDDSDIIYDLTVVRRGKDHPDLPAANKTIKNYFIDSLVEFDREESEIKTICEATRSRAYINVAQKSRKKVTQTQLKYIAERLCDGDLKKIWTSWYKAIGRTQPIEPRWLVDLDNVSEDGLKEYEDFINGLSPAGDKIVGHVPTVSGWHLITKRFNSKEFAARYPDVTFYKNNCLTLLYCPDF